MRATLACGLSLCGLMTAGGAMLAAPGQYTQRPGEMTEARVWIQNRARADAVAVTVQDVAPDTTITNSPNAFTCGRSCESFPNRCSS